MSEYGIVVSKNVMVPMRDGVRLAFDIYRPGRDGGFVDGCFPTVMLHTPYDKTDKRYSEIADFFVPKGYNVALVDLRDRYRSEASGVYYHAATPHTGRDGHDICEWIAAQPWSNGRIGTVGSSYGAITQVRTALERPPHLTAIWPDVVPTNSFQNQCREGGAMQGHMFWALFIHAQDAQDIADAPEKQQDVWNDLRDLRQLFQATPWRRGQTALRHVPPLEETLIDYYTRGAYDDYWSRIEHDYTRYWEQHADVPGTFSTGWYDPFPAADSEYYAAMAAKNTAPQRLVIGPWSHVGMRGDATFCHDVDFGPASVWGVRRYFEEQLEFFRRWLPDDATGQPAGEAPVRIFVMGGGSGRRTAEGKLDHGGAWREEWEWPLERRIETTYHLHADGSLSTEAPAGDAAPRHFTFDPAHPVPTIGGLYCAVGELPAGGAGMEQAWSRFLSPVLRLRDVLTPGPADQKEAPAFFGSREPYPRLSERPDVLVFQTAPLSGARRGDGAGDRPPVGVVERARHRLHREARGRAPGERGLSGRLRHAAQRLDHPVPLPRGLRPRGAAGARDPGGRHDHAAPDEQPLRQRPPHPRRHLVVELATAGRQPRDGRADRAAYPPGGCGADRLPRCGPAVARRSAGDPATEVIALEWCAVPAGPFTMGSEPAGEHAPDPDEAPAHRVHCPRFRIGRTPVTNAEYRLFVDATSRPAPSHWPGGAVPEERELHPVTYVSWADAAAYCRWAGGFLPTEAQWERAARGDDGRPWPWGDAPPTPAHAVFATTDTASVGLGPDGASPFGALDLAGNVWEWTASALRPYPYVSGDGREEGTSP